MPRVELLRLLVSLAFIILLSILVAYCFSQYQLQTSITIISHIRNSSSTHEHTTHSTACRPRGSMLLAKTHKTGGSTLGTIIARYGYERNFTFALPANGFIMGHGLFSENMLLQRPPQDGFDILINHVRFNKSAMKKIMHSDTVYVTILREPVARWYSTVEYYSLWKLAYSEKEYDERAGPFNIDGFLSKISKCESFICRLGQNGQLFDLGFVPGTEGIDVGAVRTKIGQLQDEFDLALITEYFDESLLLLRKLICWDFRDIVYLKKKQSKKHRKTPDGEADAIRNRNQGDVILYEYFNKTLWEKIEDYGPDFEKDLRYFRNLNTKVIEVCGDPSSPNARAIASDIFVGTVNLNLEDICFNLKRDIHPYTNLLKNLASRDGR